MKKIVLFLLIFSFSFASNIQIVGKTILDKWMVNVDRLDIKWSGHDHIDEIVVDVYDMKSTQGSEMDRNIYESMEASKYRKIVFRVESMGNRYITGNLTIKGVTKKIKVATHTVRDQIVGSFKAKLSSFNVKPPHFMLGATKKVNLMTISFAIDKP